MTPDKGGANFPLYYLNVSNNTHDEMGCLARIMFEGNCDDAKEKSPEELMEFVNKFSRPNKTHDGYKDTPHIWIDSVLKVAKQLEE